MKTQNYIFIMIILSSLLFLSQITFAEPRAEDLPHPELYKLRSIKKTFKCGDAELFTESACFSSKQWHNRQCRKQSIKLINSKKVISKKLPVDGRLVKKNFKESPGPVLDTVVTDIGCLKSESGNYFIIFEYLCSWRRECCGAENMEWQRYFTDEGTNLTVGKPNDVPYNQIFQKYGIPETGGTYVNIIYE